MDSDETETISEANKELEKNDEKSEISMLENENFQHFYSGTTQLAKLSTSTGIKISLAKNEHDLMECNRLTLQQGMSQLPYLKMFLFRWQRYRHIHCTPKVLGKQKFLVRQSSDLERLMCSPR